MSKFSIEVKALSSDMDAAQAISIRSGATVLTKLLRPGEDQPDHYLHAPPAQLAFWFVENWWRLRYETKIETHPSASWLMAHELASIGGGYVWPRLRIWGEGSDVSLVSKADPPGVINPIRYLTETERFVSGSEFIAAVTEFITSVVEQRLNPISDVEALRSCWKCLQDELIDEDIASWRRLEAQAGFDPDAAPESLMYALIGLVERYGEDVVSEAVQAHQGSDSAVVLSNQIEDTSAHGDSCDFSAALKFTSDWKNHGAPWQAAEDAGLMIRERLGLGNKPLSSRQLADFISCDPRVIDSGNGEHRAYGLRLDESGEQSPRAKISLSKHRGNGRRFEVSRAIGDAVWSRGDPLGAIGPAHTARQRFQRSFAQNLLCPFDALRDYMNVDDPEDEDIQEAAKTYDVSTQVIQTMLISRKRISQERFEELRDAVQP